MTAQYMIDDVQTKFDRTTIEFRSRQTDIRRHVDLMPGFDIRFGDMVRLGRLRIFWTSLHDGRFGFNIRGRDEMNLTAFFFSGSE